MSYTYEAALAGNGADTDVAGRRLSEQLGISPLWLNAVGSFLGGALWGAIFGGKGSRGKGALWGGSVNAVASPAWYYARQRLGGVGMAVSIFGGLAVPVYAARYGTGQTEWPPTVGEVVFLGTMEKAK